VTRCKPEAACWNGWQVLGEFCEASEKWVALTALSAQVSVCVCICFSTSASHIFT